MESLGQAARSIAGVTSAPIGEVRGQHCHWHPLFRRYSTPRNVVQVHGAGLGPASGRLQRRQNPGELLPADVAGIGMRHDYPSPDNSLSLTYFRDRRQVLRTQQPIGARIPLIVPLRIRHGTEGRLESRDLIGLTGAVPANFLVGVDSIGVATDSARTIGVMPEAPVI